MVVILRRKFFGSDFNKFNIQYFRGHNANSIKPLETISSNSWSTFEAKSGPPDKRISSVFSDKYVFEAASTLSRLLRENGFLLEKCDQIVVQWTVQLKFDPDKKYSEHSVQLS